MEYGKGKITKGSVRGKHQGLCFRLFHHLRLRLGAEPVHVAHYAKKWGALYRFLRRNVMLNAVEHAREGGFEAVTCGHTHFVEDVLCDGVRYLNTGAWTEVPIYVLLVTDEAIRLQEVKIGEPVGERTEPVATTGMQAGKGK